MELYDGTNTLPEPVPTIYVLNLIVDPLDALVDRNMKFEPS